MKVVKLAALKFAEQSQRMFGNRIRTGVFWHLSIQKQRMERVAIPCEYSQGIATPKTVTDSG